MNKFVTMLGAVTLLFATSAVLADGLSMPTVTGQVNASSRDDWRGQKMSTGADLELGLKVDNIAVKGLYVDGDFGKVGNDFPLNSYTVIRSDVGVGYAFQPVNKLSLDASFHHVSNAQEFLVLQNGKLVPGDYSEFRLKATYGILFAQVTQGVGQVQNNYAQVGVNVPVGDKVHVGAAVSGYHYKNSANNRYNNSEVFASYDVLKSLEVYGKYSFGGKADQNTALANYGVVGVNYNF